MSERWICVTGHGPIRFNTYKVYEYKYKINRKKNLKKMKTDLEEEKREKIHQFNKSWINHKRKAFINKFSFHLVHKVEFFFFFPLFVLILLAVVLLFSGNIFSSTITLFFPLQIDSDNGFSLFVAEKQKKKNV